MERDIVIVRWVDNMLTAHLKPGEPVNQQGVLKKFSANEGGFNLKTIVDNLVPSFIFIKKV